MTAVIPPGNTQEERAADDVAPADDTPFDDTASDDTASDDSPSDDSPSGLRAGRWRVPPHRRFAAAVLAAMLVGLALRVAIGLTDDAPATDETAYLRSGISLVEGDGFAREGRAETHFPPFVPLLLGLGNRVFDDPHTGTVVLTFVASTALILPLALLGRRVGGTRAGIATAWLAALAPGVSTSVANRGAGSEAVYLLVVVGALWCVVSAADHRGAARVARVAAGGLLVGLAYLTRPEGLFMGVPLGLAVLALGLRGAGDRRRRLLRTAGLAGAFAIPIVACIVPYAVYLHRHTGAWELSAKTQDASIEAWHAVARADRQERDSVLYALDETGLSFSADRTSLVQLARDDPGGYFAIVRTNIAELGEVIANPVEGQVLTWLLLPLPVWVLAVWGAWRFRRVLTMRILLALAALPVATALAFFVQPRYVMLTTALAIVPAGAALATLPGRWRAPAAGLAAVLLVVSSVQAFEGPGGWWHPSDHTDQRAAGEWLAANTADDARIMSRSMVVEYYADRPTMAIPYADLDEILDYGRHYGAQYIVADWYTVRRLRPQLLPLREGADVPGLRLVHELRREGRTTSIYAFEPVPVAPAEIGSPLGFVGDG